MPKTNVTQVRQGEIRFYLEQIDDEAPPVVKIIASALLGFERMARDFHNLAGHTNSFLGCQYALCRTNSHQLNKIYADIIALRRTGRSDMSA